MKLAIVKGSTSVTIQVFIQDSSSTTGGGLTGLVYNSAGLTCYYMRPRAAAAAVTLATQTVTGAYSSGGFVEISATNAPGWYRLDLPDAVVASGVDSVGVHLKGATNMAPLPLEIQLTSVNLNDSVRGGMTALPNANAGAAGGIPTDSTGSTALINDIWDEVLTGGTHNIADSAGRRIRDLQEFGTYEGAQIFIDSVNGNAGTTDYESGTNLNPITNMSDANTLAASLNLSRFAIAPASTITLAASQAGQVFSGVDYTVALNNSDISNSQIIGAYLSGTVTAPTGDPVFLRCVLNNVTLPPCTISDSTMEGTITIGSAGELHFHNTHCGNLAGCTIDLGAAIGNTSLAIHNWSGIIDFQNMGQAGTDFIGIGGHGIITINANSVGGEIHIHGDFEVTDNSGGLVTIIYDDNTTNIQAIIEDTASIGVVKNAPFSNFEFLMVASADHITPKTGLTVSGARSIDGGAFSGITGVIAEVSNGIYQVDFSAADTNGDVITYKFSATDADDTFVTIKTRA